MADERKLTDADRVWLALGDDGAMTIAQLLQQPDLEDLTLRRVLVALRELLTDGHVTGEAGIYRRT